MKTNNKMIGALAVIMGLMAITAFVLPALAAPIMNQIKTQDQTQIQDQLQTQTQETLGTCTETCTQQRIRTRAMDGSCGNCTTTCSGEQYQTKTRAENCVNEGTQLKTQSRVRARSCSNH
ncbi:hypothetical protein FJY84_04140 [Candidatus Bathyarchaeota archaeon]|nr:hypothetical protein [Candidatus Bathyarchaeota archaeon]